jgi:hypothetical protein
MSGFRNLGSGTRMAAVADSAYPQRGGPAGHVGLGQVLAVLI